MSELQLIAAANDEIMSIAGGAQHQPDLGLCNSGGRWIAILPALVWPSSGSQDWKWRQRYE